MRSRLDSIRPPGQRQQFTLSIKPTTALIIEPATAPIKPTMAPIIEPTAPIELKTAPRAANDRHANSHLANDLHAIQLPRVVILCSPASPRVSPLITIQFSSPKLASSFKFSTKSSAQPPSGLPLPSSPMLPSSSMLPNQPLPIHWPNGFPSSGVFLFLFTSSPLPPQTPTLWPTQVPSWVSFFFFFYCIIGLTSMLLPQGCVDPLIPGYGQTFTEPVHPFPDQPHIHANTIRSSREQHRCSHNL
jgi:hypothetical protein